MNTHEYFRLSADQVGLLEHVGNAPRALLNIPARIDLTSEIDEEKLLEAMRLTVTRLPYCTIRLNELEDGSFMQYYSEEGPEGIETVDMSSCTAGEIDAYILKQATLTFADNCNNSQLYNIKLIRGPGGKHTIFFCGYHVIMDTYGVMYTITYFDKVYAALMNGTDLPPAGMGPEKHIEESWEYKNSPKNQIDIDWWCEQFETEPHFSSMNPKGSPEYEDGKNYGHAQTFAQMRACSMPLRIPAETVAEINKAAAAAKVSPQLYFVLALRTFLSKMSGSADVTIGTTGARRATLVQKHCGMTLAHLVSWRSVIEDSNSFEAAIQKLNVIQKDMYRHINVLLSDYEERTKERFNVPKDGLYRSVVFTYQPYFNVENTNLKFTANHVNTGITCYPLYLNLMPHDASGDLWADYIYAVGYIDPKNLEIFHDFMLKFISAGMSVPTKTIGELVKETL